MALAALGISITQQRLARMLQTTDAGTPFSRIRQLTGLGVTIEVGTGGTLPRLETALAANTVVIAAVHAGWLPYAQIESPHAVVVVARTDVAVTVLDPATTGEPIDVPVDAWLAAWTEMNFAYARVKTIA